MLEIEVFVEVRPTEDIEKVKRCVLNFIDPEEIYVETYGDMSRIVARARGARSLDKLYYALRRQRILDAARTHLRQGVVGDSIVFHLHKQAAYVGAVSFCTVPEKESPLGSIMFMIRTDSPKQFIDWLTPRTVDGKPVREADPPDP